MKDRLGNEIYVGAQVIWFDPENECFDPNRIWTVDRIDGDMDDSIILISDNFGEAEVFACELEVIEYK